MVKSSDLIDNVWRREDRTALEDHSPHTLFDDLETEAAKRAGRSAGDYLTGINKFNLADLETDEWRKFCSVLILGYEAELIGLLSEVSA